MADVLYLLSSLPHIDLYTNEKDMIQVPQLDTFLEDCEVLGEVLSKTVSTAIQTPNDSKKAIARRWAEYEYSIRNELAKKRWGALRHGTYTSILIHDEVPVTAEAIDVISAVYQENNPYLREKVIIETKWGILESLDQEYLFSIENIIIYGWKIQLYYSYRNFTEDRGKTRWNGLLHSLADKSGFSIAAINGGTNE